MTIPDGVTALPYIGEDPPAVLLFQDCVNTARGHFQTFSAELSSARSSTNAAWQATEATTADYKTSGIADSGELVVRSLDAGSKAVGSYLTVLTQGRRAVDVLREQWNVARTQAGALDARTIITAEDEANAKADVARLTDQFQDFERQFKSIVTMVETAAAECSAALISAAGVGAGPEFKPASFQLDPPTDPIEESWWAGDKTRRHNTVQNFAFQRVQAWVLANGGDVNDVQMEAKVVGGSKENNGRDGYADILYVDYENQKVYVYEVKGTIPDGGRKENAEKGAALDLSWYKPFLARQYPGFEILGGESIGQGLSVDYDPLSGAPERLEITETTTPGAIIYTPSPRQVESPSAGAPPTTPSTEPPEPPPIVGPPDPTDPPPPPSDSSLSNTDDSQLHSLLNLNSMSLDPEVLQEREDRAEFLLHLLSAIPELLNPLGVLAG